MAQDDAKTAPSRVNIVYNSNEDAKSEVELPFKVLVLGDFTGVEDKTLLSERESVSVNADNLDAVMSALAPRIEISVRDTLRGEDDTRIPVILTFESLEDFTPKRLVDGIKPMHEARTLRQSLYAARQALAERQGLAEEIRVLLNDERVRNRLREELRKVRKTGFPGGTG
jgi:type VI secretion system protein ImpB